MPIDQVSATTGFVLNSFIFIKAAFIILSVLYFILTLIILQQVRMVTETVITEGDPILRAVSIMYAGLALGIIVLFIGFL